MLLLEDRLKLYLKDVYTAHISNIRTILAGIIWYSIWNPDSFDLFSVGFYLAAIPYICITCDLKVIYFLIGCYISFHNEFKIIPMMFLYTSCIITYCLRKIVSDISTSYNKHMGFIMTLSISMYVCFMYYYQLSITLLYSLILYIMILLYSTYIIIIKEFPEGNKNILYHGTFLHIIIHKSKISVPLPKLSTIEINLDHIRLKNLSSNTMEWGREIFNKWTPPRQPGIPLDGSSFTSEDERLSWQGEIVNFIPKSTICNFASRNRTIVMQNICYYANTYFIESRKFIFGYHIITKFELDEIRQFVQDDEIIVSVFARGGWLECFLRERGLNIIVTDNTARQDYKAAIKWLPDIRNITNVINIIQEFTEANVLIINRPPPPNAENNVLTLLNHFTGSKVILFDHRLHPNVVNVLNEKYKQVETKSKPIYEYSNMYFYVKK
ncbi:hypothetical protein TCON_2159 [Astathelohania contejeani]|uniref:Uncharacterized protein n=1 Tax=Astathelohania contejeani TaxID=164912 RepID=A0ABQ7HWU8_9MICR|nr:hypothetical protein TCON_2159 [Thelohania contejeani]